MNEQDEIWEIELRSGSYLKGVAKGRQEARQEARREVFVEVILAVLEVRGVDLDADTEARIRGCEDLATLERWARLARQVQASTELFADA